MKRSDFHYVGDGRGRRRVYINGNQINHVVWADIGKGVLLFHPHPFRRHKNRRDEIYSRKLRGNIEIVPMEDEN